MYRIAICDDERSSVQDASKMIGRYSDFHENIEISVDVFYTSLDFLEALEKNSYDIYFLDIYIDRINGIDLADVIRKNNENANIIFMTSSNAFYKEAFRIHAVHYLEKPILEEDFFEAMDRVINLDTEIHYISFKDGGNVHRIDVERIVCIESEDHYKRINAGEETFLVRSTIQELKDELEFPYFYPLGKKSIINLKKVLKISKENVIMENGKKFSVPRGKYRTLSELVLKYTF